MPSERSIYRKIQEVLSVTKAKKVSSLQELRAVIAEQPGDMFKTQQYNQRTDKVVPKVSIRVIGQAVRICHLLELIDDEGTLTDIGRQAFRRARFDKIVANQVRARLKEYRVNLSHLNRVITEGFQERPPVLPTSMVLWEAGGGDMPKGLFTKFLTLLAHCGRAESSQSKVYLHIDTK